MSAAQLGFVCRRGASYVAATCASSGAPKRFVHRAPDYAYVKAGLERSSHYAALVSEGAGAMKDYPKLIERYVKTAAVMKARGKVPFAHAQPSIYRAGRIFLEAFYERDPAAASYFRYLRIPSREFSVDRESLIDKINAYVKEHGSCGWTPGEWNFNVSRLDTDPEFRPFMISLSYSMMDFTRGESAFDFLFRSMGLRRVDIAKKMMQDAIHTCLKRRGLESKVSQVMERLFPLCDAYNELEANSLFAIGVPEDKVGRFTYDAKSFGIPTGEDVSEVAKAPWNASRAFSTEEGGLQARLLMYKETMDPKSGLEVIDINDEAEVSGYCEGHSLSSVADVPEFSRFFPHRTTKAEEKFRQTERRLDEQVRDLALYMSA